LLGKFGIERQAKLEPADYLVYAERLVEFDLGDIKAVLDRIASKPLEQYEKPWPEIAVLRKACADRVEQRRTRIRPEQLRPEARQAFFAPVDNMRALAAGGLRGSLEPIGDVMKQLEDGLSMDRSPRVARLDALAARVASAPPAAPECPHCGHSRSPQTILSLRSLSRYYAQRADATEDAEEKAAAEAAQAASEAGEGGHDAE
jgi:hypothetical protein